MWGGAVWSKAVIPNWNIPKGKAMANLYKLAALAGVVLSTVVTGPVIAANHDLVFDGWSVTNGQIDETGTTGTSICAVGTYDCNTVAAGDGFKQIQVTAKPDTAGAVAGESYIMTIVTDQNANGTPGAGELGFYDVSFVKMKLSLGGGASSNNNENGIASQQRISEVTAGTGGGTATSFTSDTDINTGWSVAATPVSISQTLVDNGDTATSGDNFDSNFNYQSSNDAETGLRDGFAMSIDQVAGLASSVDPLSVNDVQVFSLRERQGTMLASGPGTVTLAGNVVNWVNGDDIKAIWLGQTINLDSTSATAGGLGSTFGYLSFENVSNSTIGPATEFGFATSNAESAWVWDPAFNVGLGSKAPCLTDPSGATCP